MYGQAEGTLGQRLTPTADPSDPCQQGPLIFNVLKALGNNKSNHKNENGKLTFIYDFVFEFPVSFWYQNRSFNLTDRNSEPQNHRKC